MSDEKGIGKWFRDTLNLDPSRDVLVVGLGQFGITVGRTLEELGQVVLGIDIEQARVDRYARLLSQTVRADATESDALRALGADQFERAIVAIEDDVEASVLTVAALAEIGVGDIWALASSPAHFRILPLVGASHVVYPDREVGERVARLMLGKMADFVALRDGFALAEVAAATQLHGKTLVELELRDRFGVTLVTVRPAGGETRMPWPNTVINAGDVLMVAGPAAKVVAFCELT